MGTYWLFRRSGKIVGGVHHPSKNDRDVRTIRHAPSEYLQEAVNESRTRRELSLPSLDLKGCIAEPFGGAARCSDDTVAAIWKQVVTAEMNEYYFQAIFDVSDAVLKKWSEMAKVRLRQTFVPLVAKRVVDQAREAAYQELLRRTINELRDRNWQ